MAINYPTTLDTLTNPTGNDRVDTVDHAGQHADVNDAVEALEAKVGADSSAVTSSHDFKLSAVVDGDKAVSIDGDETITGNKTFTTGAITSTRPKVATSIDDTNGNELLSVTPTTAAVNQIGVTNAITTEDPLIDAVGGDTNISLKIKAKGTGKVKIGAAELQMPNVDGTASQVITTNGSGVLSFSSATAPTLGTSSTATLSVTTSGTQTIMVWAKASHEGGGTAGNATISLKYNAVTKDTVVSDDGTAASGSVAVQYTEVPAAGTQDITLTTSSGSLANIKIMYILIG